MVNNTVVYGKTGNYGDFRNWPVSIMSSFMGSLEAWIDVSGSEDTTSRCASRWSRAVENCCENRKNQCSEDISIKRAANRRISEKWPEVAVAPIYRNSFRVKSNPKYGIWILFGLRISPTRIHTLPMLYKSRRATVINFIPAFKSSMSIKAFRSNYS